MSIHFRVSRKVQGKSFEYFSKDTLFPGLRLGLVLSEKLIDAHGLGIDALEFYTFYFLNLPEFPELGGLGHKLRKHIVRSFLRV